MSISFSRRGQRAYASRITDELQGKGKKRERKGERERERESRRTDGREGRGKLVPSGWNGKWRFWLIGKRAHKTRALGYAFPILNGFIQAVAF